MILLRLDRADHAAKQLALMQEADEDATITQLTAGWLDLYQVREVPAQRLLGGPDVFMKGGT
jgi:hypothetical protein